MRLTKLIEYFSVLLLLKIKMVSVTTQAVIASTYTMEEGYDKNERPSKYFPIFQFQFVCLYICFLNCIFILTPCLLYIFQNKSTK